MVLQIYVSSTIPSGCGVEVEGWGGVEVEGWSESESGRQTYGTCP